MTDFKPILIAELDVLRRVSLLETAGTFKARSYASAIKTLSGLPTIRSLADIPASTKGDGLGKEIRIKIQRILETGSLDISPEVRARADAMDTLSGIYGVGPKKVEELLAAGYMTIAQIRAAVTNKTLTLNRNQLTGLRYYEDINSRIPRTEMEAHAALLMSAKPASLEGRIVGSYRRGATSSGDIDMLVRTTDASVDVGVALAEYVKTLQREGYIKDVLAQGAHKCLAVSQLPSCRARRLDLLVTPPEEFPFAVFYFTGCDTFNVAVRSHALTRGFTLNEHALTQVSTGRTVGGIRTEKDIFAALKIQWREPHERTGPEACMPLSPK